MGLLEIGKLMQLHELELGNTPITDKGLKHLGGLEQLHKLTLPITEMVTNDAVAELRKRGFKAFRLEDGYPEWKAAGFPVEDSVAV